MTTNYHTSIPTSPAQPANAETVNSPLSELDTELVAQDGRITVLEGDMPVLSGVASEYYDGLGGFSVPSGTGSTNGHIIQDEGVDQTQRVKLNFTGVGVSVVDTPSATEVQINGGGVAASIAFTATDKLLGRSSSGAGAGEEIPLTAAGRALIAALDAKSQRTLLELVDGWLQDTNTWSYSSVDSPTGILSVNADVTALIGKGTKIKYNQSQALTYYWTFDASSAASVGSPTMANIGTPTYAAGKYSNALTLNGSNQALSITDAADLKPTGEFTLGLWYKSAGTGVAQMLFQSYSDNTNANGIHLEVTAANVLTFGVGNNSAADSTTLTGTTVIADGSWHYLVVAYRNNLIQIYVDGVLEVSGYTETPTYAATNYVQIGVRNVAGSNVAATWVNGQIDDLFLINGYALDEGTVNAKYIAATAQGTGSITITKQAIVTAVGVYSGGATLITAYHGTDFTLANSTISSPYYSNEKTPRGFNTSPNKWSVIVTDVQNRIQSSPATTPTYYNWTSIVVPIGAWRVSYRMIVGITATASSLSYYGTLSTSASAESDPEITTFLRNNYPSSASYGMDFVMTHEKVYELRAKSTRYLNIAANTAGAGAISIRGDLGKTIIKAVCAYL